MLFLTKRKFSKTRGLCLWNNTRYPLHCCTTFPNRRHLSLSSATRCVVYSWNGVLGINFFVHIFQQLISLTSSEIFRYFRDVATVGLGEGGGGVSGGFYFRICMFYHQLLAYYTSGYPRGYVGQYRGLVRNCRRYVRDS